MSVALGVQGAGNTLMHFAVSTAQPAIAKQITAQTLTKTAWYNPLKAALRAVSVSLTKSSFGRAASKVVPLVGGFACGGITFVGLKAAGKRLSGHLAKLSQADPNMELRAQEIVVEVPVVDEDDDESDTDFVECVEPAEGPDV